MTIHDQRLEHLLVKNLKSMRDLEVSFSGHDVTAILGPNGNGKSTVLHALACAFQPVDSSGENYKFSNFFLPHPDALWQGSEMAVFYSYSDNGKRFANQERVIRKKDGSDRWTPRYVNRPRRNVVYLGVDKCVPLIESEKKQVRMSYSTSRRDEDVIDIVIDKASYILNRRYTAVNMHDAGRNKKFIGVEAGGVRYSALSMSAGEQKVFLVLEKVFRAKKYSLILVDELDLLLHDMALKRLVEVLVERARKRSLQIVFTTHRDTILNCSEVNIRHVVNTAKKTLCLEETTPDSIARLTGVQPKLYEIFVEDDLAYSVVQKVAADIGMARNVSISLYGAASNCFVTAGGLALSGKLCDRSLFVLDGDEQASDRERKEGVRKVVTGDDERANQCRQLVHSRIKQFVLPRGYSPEQYLHKMIVELEEPESPGSAEIFDVARDVRATNERHQFVDFVIKRIGWSRDVGLSKIIDLASTSPEWHRFVAEVQEWLVAVAQAEEDVREAG